MLISNTDPYLCTDLAVHKRSNYIRYTNSSTENRSVIIGTKYYFLAFSYLVTDISFHFECSLANWEWVYLEQKKTVD